MSDEQKNTPKGEKGKMGQYACDKNQRVTVRFTPQQFAFVAEMANTMGVSPSDVIRMMVNSGMVTWNAKKGDMRRENEQTCINHQL